MKEKGFTLIEVLVAMLVLSLGLLGTAGLLATGIKNNQGAYQRTQATWMAYDVMDRMRANRAVALAQTNNYNVALGTATSTSSGIAATDINGWKTALARVLPAGDGSVTVTPATRTVTVIIQWNDARGTGGATAQQFRVDSVL